MGVDRSWIEALNDIKNSDYIPLSDYGSEIAAVDGFVSLPIKFHFVDLFKHGYYYSIEIMIPSKALPTWPAKKDTI